MKWKILLLILCVIVASSTLSAQTLSTKPTIPSLSPAQIDELVSVLQQGGYIFYFRHAATNHKQVDERPVDLNNCKSQRNLSDLGRKQSKTIAKAFKKLNIPVGDVLSSPFCRCKETAELAFGSATLNDKLYFAIGLKRDDKISKSKFLLKELSTPFPGKKNKVIVSHTSNLKESTGIWPKPEGAAFIFQPLSDGNYKTVGRVHPDTWKAIVERP